jgi:hypothetical protein
MESDSLATDFSLRVVYAIGFHAKIVTANEHEKHDERCREAHGCARCCREAQVAGTFRLWDMRSFRCVGTPRRWLRG